MTSKKTNKNNQVKLPRRSDCTKQFKVDWLEIKRKGADMSRVQAVMSSLEKNEVLGAEWKDHALKGEWADYRECHIGGDLLLIYQINKTDDLIHFVRLGSHASLFEN